jgi:6-pyruvoyltetrahydropterin/6-carboxytetrahydropterin synthase
MGELNSERMYPPFRRAKRANKNNKNTLTIEDSPQLAAGSLQCLLTFSLRFFTCHRLSSPFFNDRKNLEVYGKCANPRGHGHDYLVSITLKGRPAPETGMLFPRDRMFRIARRTLEPLMSYRCLNRELGEDFITTGENIVKLLWEKLNDKFKPCTLHRIRVQETPKNFFAYYGD